MAKKTTKEIWGEIHQRRHIDARLRRAAFRLEASTFERAWAIVSAHRAGHSVRDIASRVGLSPARVHQILNSPDADIAEPRLDALRVIGWPTPEDSEIGNIPREQVAARLADEADLLRQCTEWLQALGRNEHPRVNLRPDLDEPRDLYVAVDQTRVERILERIAFDLDELARARRFVDQETHTHPVLQHRHRLAEPAIEPPKGPMSIPQARRAWEAYEERLRRAGLPIPPNPYRHLDRSGN